jgi:RNA polymerase sigma-70 factor (TIGR02943 family)
MTNNKEINPQEWLSEYGDYLYAFALSRVKLSHLAEDLVQDTLVSALKNYQKFKGESSFRTWLTAILKNKIFDYYKKDSRLQPLPEESENSAGFNSGGIWNVYVADWGSRPDERLQDKAFMNAFAGCFDKLKPQIKQLFELKLKDDLSTEEICKVMEISSTNLWVLLHRARQQLRNCLDKNWYKNE